MRRLPVDARVDTMLRIGTSERLDAELVPDFPRRAHRRTYRPCEGIASATYIRQRDARA